VPEIGAQPEDLVLARLHGLSPFQGTELDWVLRTRASPRSSGSGLTESRHPEPHVRRGERQLSSGDPRDAVAGLPRPSTSRWSSSTRSPRSRRSPPRARCSTAEPLPASRSRVRSKVESGCPSRVLRMSSPTQAIIPPNTLVESGGRGGSLRLRDARATCRYWVVMGVDVLVRSRTFVGAPAASLIRPSNEL